MVRKKTNSKHLLHDLKYYWMEKKLLERMWIIFLSLCMMQLAASRIDFLPFTFGFSIAVFTWEPKGLHETATNVFTSYFGGAGLMAFTLPKKCFGYFPFWNTFPCRIWPPGEPRGVHWPEVFVAAVQRPHQNRESGGADRVALPLLATQFNYQDWEPGTLTETGFPQHQ